MENGKCINFGVMDITFLRLLTDTGFFVLIWAVQLVIYPSFKYYSKNDLNIWHISYTKRITFIVLPLMFSQLILACLHIYQYQDWYTILILLIVISLWLLTFIIFVPLHQRIDNNTFTDETCCFLVNRNWIRTLLWSLLFTLTLIYFLYK